MTSMKFTLADIPKLHHAEWSRIMHKKAEPGQEGEWYERQTRLRLMARGPRNKRLAGLLRHHPLPLPGANHANSRKEAVEYSHHYVGSLPASVFLEICMFSDIKTATILEGTCSAACSILRSPAAEATWRHLRLVAGLEAKYPGWDERQFLRFAFRRLCHCGSEGVTLWTFAMTLCGDCFAKHVTTTDETVSNVGKDLKRAMPSLHSGVYAARGRCSLMPDSVRLLSRHYVGAVQDWVSEIPVATKAQFPQDFLATYLEQETEAFCMIAKACETWQEKHCSTMTGVRRRRTLAIVRAVQSYKPEFVVTSLIDGDRRWQTLVSQPYPFSEQEWKKRGKKMLEILKVG